MWFDLVKRDGTKYIEMLEKWGFRMSKINTIDGDSVELTRIQQELQG
jgi:hypothetical protein